MVVSFVERNDGATAEAIFPEIQKVHPTSKSTKKRIKILEKLLKKKVWNRYEVIWPRIHFAPVAEWIALSILPTPFVTSVNYAGFFLFSTFPIKPKLRYKQCSKSSQDILPPSLPRLKRIRAYVFKPKTVNLSDTSKVGMY